MSRHQSKLRWVALMLPNIVTVASAPAGEIIYPVADGTLSDGGGSGAFDGVADRWNWTFTPTGFAGAVTLTTETPISAVEHRIVCEYDLRGVRLTPPFHAALTFTVRGARVLPFPDVTLHVYSYPADLVESPGDFSVGPAVRQGVVTVAAMQAPQVETIDVTAVVTASLRSSAKRVAFRFQIDPDTPHVTNQVFIDALDAQPATKPLLTIRSAVPGDADDDGDADLADFAVLTDCLGGPGASPQPVRPGVTATDCLRVFDREIDADVDLDDLAGFLRASSGG